MARTSRRADDGMGGQQQVPQGRELMELKMALAASYERGERGALGRILSAHPGHVAELSEFAAALVATSGHETEVPTPQTMAVAQRATARAFASVFAQTAAPQPASAIGVRAVASLKALRRARGVSLAGLARQLGLGVDVLADVEAGIIRAASIPDRLTTKLGELLQTSAEQVRRALESQPVVRPAYGRDPSSTQEVAERDFAEAVKLSTSMSAQQKSEWLASS
jgi:hypothetical protein